MAASPGFEPGGGPVTGGGVGPGPPPPPSPPPPPPSPPPPPPPGTIIDAPASIQQAVNAGANGATFILRGTFNNQEVFPKPQQRFFAHSTGARMDGQFSKERGIDNDQKVGVTISGIEFLRYIDGGIRSWKDGLVTHNIIHDCHGTGMGAGLEDQGGHECAFNEVYNCGSVELLGHDSGGIKFARAGDFIATGAFDINTRTYAGKTPSYVHDNYVHDNIGNGIWWDVGSFFVICEDNLIVNNGRKGLFQEKGYGPCWFKGNRVYKNGWEGEAGDGPRYGNILNASSKNCIFEDNITWDATNKRGLSWYDRDDSAKHYTGSESNWHITGNTTRRNKLYGGDLRKCSNDSNSPNPCSSGGVNFVTGGDADQFFAGAPP